MDNSQSLAEIVKGMIKTNRKVCENQTHILRYLGGIDKRLTILEMAATPSAPRENTARGKRFDGKVVNIQQLSQDINDVETRMKIIETKLEQIDKGMVDSQSTSDMTGSEGSTDGLVGFFQNADSLSMGSWSDNDASLKSQRHSGFFTRKGSFKAASLAIVFVNRLTVQAPSHVQPRHGDNQAGRSGADNLKRAARAVIFMIKLMKALNLPHELSQQEINPD